jgi:hypothetical protein
MFRQKALCFMFFIGIFLTQANAINLGGTNVAKEKFIVYLLIGHSEMAGITTTNNDNVTDPHAWVYRWGTTKNWELAKENGTYKAGLSGRGTGGPGMAFLKLMVSRHSDYYFGVVSNACPSATCHGINTGGNGSDFTAEQDRYWRDALLFQEIIKAARAIQKEVTLGGVLCMLGCVEATRATDVTVCQNFANDMTQMATDIRDSLGLPKLPFVIADYEKGASGDFSVSNPWPAIIAKQLDSIPFKLSCSVIVNSAGIQMTNDHHFSIAGEGEWARRAVDSLEANHFFPSGSVGVLEKPAAATPQPSDSQKIVLTHPNYGESFTVGDTVSIQWVCIDDIMYVDIFLSADQGKTWILLNGQSIAYNDTARWGHFKWRIPAKITSKQGVTFSLADNHECLFRVENYSPNDKSEISASAQPMTILAGSGIINANDRGKRTTSFNFNTMLAGSFTPASFLKGRASRKLFDLRGKALLVGKSTAPGLIVCAKKGCFHEE